ncbi:MAG: arsenate reductase/protein-tyrosine-phosphatase family protein [Promethearchaeota archaeon]
MLPQSVLVVCYGNTCRSPVGEYLLRSFQKNSFVRIASAGLHPSFNKIASNSEKYLDLRGISYDDFSPHRVTRALIEQYDRILVMEQYMQHEIQANFCQGLPDLAQKIIMWSEYAGESGDVEDPYMNGKDTYFRILDIIERQAQKIVEKWKEE